MDSTEMAMRPYPCLPLSDKTDAPYKHTNKTTTTTTTQHHNTHHHDTVQFMIDSTELAMKKAATRAAPSPVKTAIPSPSPSSVLVPILVNNNNTTKST